MTTPFDWLGSAHALTLGDRLLPGAAGYKVGMVATVLADANSTRLWLEAHGPDLSAHFGKPLGSTPVGDPWRFMRRAAGEGLAGITDAASSKRFMFMVRVEEAASTLPTVLVSLTETGWGPGLTRAGVRNLAHAEVLHWQRFDIVDRVSGEWGKRCPFRGWNHGDTLYELRSERELMLLTEVPLLGPWISTSGAFAFFTSEQDAWHFLEQHAPVQRVHTLHLDPGPRPEVGSVARSFRPWPVHDLATRLRELAAIDPLASWCVNPHAHRENSACGELPRKGMRSDGLFDGDAPPPRMRSVAGVWSVLEANKFALEQFLAPWTGQDTVMWSGGQSVQLRSLDRSLVASDDRARLQLDGDITESELVEILERFLTSPPDSSQRNESPDVTPPELQLKSFHVCIQDNVTRTEYHGIFAGFPEACQYLGHIELAVDRVHREQGAWTCVHPGFTGSGDAEYEETRGERFQTGLMRLCRRALVEGYHPSLAEDLVALCNGTFRTTRVDLVGYAADLLWTCPDESLDEVLAKLDIEATDWQSWVQGISISVDPAGEQRVVSRIGTDAWSRLSEKSRHFVATALVHLDRQGSAPSLDYAPISLEIVKALEVEMGRLFESFRSSETWQNFAWDPTDEGDQVFYKFLSGGKPPTLGQMRYLLRQGVSPLRIALREYLSGLPNGDFVIGEEFTKSGLDRVLNKFRNGGAHDSAISEKTCIECVETLIGTPDQPGYIPRVASVVASRPLGASH